MGLTKEKHGAGGRDVRLRTRASSVLGAALLLTLPSACGGAGSESRGFDGVGAGGAAVEAGDGPTGSGATGTGGASTPGTGGTGAVVGGASGSGGTSVPGAGGAGGVSGSAGIAGMAGISAGGTGAVGTGGIGAVAGTGGIGGAAGSGGVGVGGGAGTGPIPGQPPLRCFGDSSQTIMVGDSYLALTGAVTNFLQSYSGQLFRTHYFNSTQMKGGLPPNIPQQARDAYQQGPVESIIMTGGGNDVLMTGFPCRIDALGAPCLQVVHGVVDAAAAMLQEAADNGVREVVYFFYPNVPGGLLAPASLNQTLDYAEPLVRGVCESAAVDCTFIDLRPAFAGHPEYILFDGIHPTNAGSEVIAQLVWAAMQDNCVGGLSSH